MKKYLFLLAFFGFLMAYCHKEAVTPTTIVEGTVVEFGTKKPIPNVLLFLNKSAGFSGSWATNWTNLDTFRTDATGHYRYSFTHEAGGNYELVLRLPPLYAGYVYGNVENGRVTQKEFVLDPPCWLRLRVQNTNPVNQRDSLIISYGVYRTFVGISVDTTFRTYSYFSGNRFVILYPTVIKNGIRTQRQDSVFCSANDTTLLHIKY